MHLTGTAIAPDAPLMSAGLDSIMAAEFAEQVNELLGTYLTSTLLFDHPSLRSIVASIQTTLAASNSAGEITRNAVFFEMAPQNLTCPTNICSLAQTISGTLLHALGTSINTNSPLMAAGLDSIAVTEFTSRLAEQVRVNLPLMLLFDHPTIESIAGFISESTVDLVKLQISTLQGASEQTEGAASLAQTAATSFTFTLPGCV